MDSLNLIKRFQDANAICTELFIQSEYCLCFVSRVMFSVVVSEGFRDFSGGGVGVGRSSVRSLTVERLYPSGCFDEVHAGEGWQMRWMVCVEAE